MLVRIGLRRPLNDSSVSVGLAVPAFAHPLVNDIGFLTAISLNRKHGFTANRLAVIPQKDPL